MGASVGQPSRPSGARPKSSKSANIALILGAIVVSVLAGELLARLIDHRDVFAGATHFGTPEVPIDDYVARIESGRKGVGELWRRFPAPLTNRGQPNKEDLQRLRELGGKNIDTENSIQITPMELFKVWNARLIDQACTHYALKYLARWPFSYFEPPGKDDHPRFRYRPNATSVQGLVTNQIGWRGKPIVDRAPETIRIVFVGASTIAESGQMPWSAPELLEEWLNAWARDSKLKVRFQVLNAGRDGATTSDVVAIVRDEVVPLHPDLVIFYEGALQFDWSSTVVDAGQLKVLPRPQFEDQAGWVASAARQSSLFAHLLTALTDAGLPVGAVEEAKKPRYEIAWPTGLDENDPDIARPDLPLNLSQILRDFDRIRLELEKVGAEFALSSFAWLVHDGLKVHPLAGRYIWETNNRYYWPWSYRDIRRGLDFENRVYGKFASSRGLPFLDVARLIPPEPSLYFDGVHMTQGGVRVKAWAFFRELLPLLERRLASGALPRAASGGGLPTFEVKYRSVQCN